MSIIDRQWNKKPDIREQVRDVAGMLVNVVLCRLRGGHRFTPPSYKCDRCDLWDLSKLRGPLS